MQRVKNPPIPLKDFASIESMREEINEVVAFLQNPGAFQEMGARAPRVCYSEKDTYDAIFNLITSEFYVSFWSLDICLPFLLLCLMLKNEIMLLIYGRANRRGMMNIAMRTMILISTGLVTQWHHAISSPQEGEDDDDVIVVQSCFAGFFGFYEIVTTNKLCNIALFSCCKVL